MNTFCIIHRSYLGPVWECRAKRHGRGWKVLGRNLDAGDTWEFAEEVHGWQPLAALKRDQFMVCTNEPDNDSEWKFRHKPGMWPDGTMSEASF
jgi:hypothetical protein